MGAYPHSGEIYTQSVYFLPAALRAAQICRYLVYSEADFEVFRGFLRVKFGVGEGTEGPLHHAKFHPHRCNDKGVGPPKLNFLLRFDRNVEYKRPAGAYPCAIFTKFAEFVHRFRMRWVLKFGWICSRVMELWGFNFRGSGFPQIFSAPSGETMRQTTKPFGGERTCWRSSITMPSLVGLGFHPPPGGQKR